MSLNIDLTDRRAVVTGVSSGIGAGIALALAQAGCDVAGCGLEDVQSPGAKRFLDNAQKYGRKAYYQSVDLADAVQASAVAGWAAEQLGGLDMVVSNAGRNINKGVAHTSEVDWDANIELNLASHWRIIQAAKPYLEQARQPVIVITVSNHAHRTIPNSFPYNVAKAGLAAMVQSLSIEWGPHIRTVGIAPGFIETPLSESWFNAFPDPQGKRTQIAGIHPVGRMGTPEDIGAFCAFLCSPMAGFISGVTLLIDGGRSALMQDV